MNLVLFFFVTIAALFAGVVWSSELAVFLHSQMTWGGYIIWCVAWICLNVAVRVASHMLKNSR